jgi:hypothetical protein
MKRKCLVLIYLAFIGKFSAVAQDTCAVCELDLNLDTTYVAAVKETMYRQSVLPSIRKINELHHRAYIEYEIPFSLFLNASGITSMFGKIIPDCCVCCDSKKCVPPVKVRRFPNTNCAFFTWDNPIANTITKDTIIGDYKYTLQIGRHISGKIAVSSDLLKITLNPPDNPDDIEIIIANAGIPLGHVTYVVSCIESSALHGVLMPHSMRPFKFPFYPVLISPK